jgi:glycosyltransferase involved in cell wall biosynthesis
MKVLLVHNRYRSESPSGEDRVVDQEGDALLSAGHDVERFERLSDDIDGWSLPRKALVPGRVVWSRETRSSLSRLLRRLRPDVVHVHNTFPLISPSALFACRDEGVPAVVTFHNYRPICPSGDLFRDGAICHDCVGHLPLPGLRHGCYRGSALATAPLAVATVAQRPMWRDLPSAYVFISRAQRELFSPLGLPGDRVFVKANLIPAVSPTAAPPEHKVVYLGRLSDTKGLPVLMDAWERFSGEHPAASLRLSIAGSGPLEAAVRAWSDRHRSVDMMGLLDRAACARLVASARAVVAPSQWEETFGLVVVEAMAAGVPPIASAHGSFPDLITDDVDGVLFAPGDASALARVLGELDSAPQHFADLGRRARLTYERRFDPDDNLEQLLSIYCFACQHARLRREAASRR